MSLGLLLRQSMIPILHHKQPSERTGTGLSHTQSANSAVQMKAQGSYPDPLSCHNTMLVSTTGLGTAGERSQAKVVRKAKVKKVLFQAPK